jgi:CHAT domain-containing protein
MMQSAASSGQFLGNAKEAIERVRTSNIVHFCYHGDSGLQDPSRSHLKLGGKDDKIAQRLSFKQVSALKS